MPAPGDFLHEYYQLFASHELKNFVSSHTPQWYNTTPHIRRILPVAQDRELWKELCTKWLFQPVAVRFAAVMLLEVSMSDIAPAKKTYM